MKVVLVFAIFCTLQQFDIVSAKCGPECYPAAYDDAVDAEELEVEDRLFGGLFVSLSSALTNKYYLFTRDNTEGELFNETTSTIDITKKTVLIAHGFTSDSVSGYTETLKDAYLNSSDVNVIGVDWSGGAKNLLYNVASKSVQSAGQQLGDFIDVLATKFNLPPEELHLIGHSLGAHVVGVANQYVESGNIGRVTGLDPAGPCFHLKSADERISTDSGNFVDVLHTCGRLLGLFAPLGHVDFYSYKGVATQPGCSALDVVQGGSCSHSKAWLIYIDAVENPTKYEALKCSNYKSYQANKCTNNTSTYLGEDTDTTATGIHYFSIG